MAMPGYFAILANIHEVYRGLDAFRTVPVEACIPSDVCFPVGLHMASANGHATVVKLLLEKGAVSRPSISIDHMQIEK